MLTVLQSLYSCQIERCFLSLATNLLLEMTSQSPDFKRNMFEYPLSECTFQVGNLQHLFLSVSVNNELVLDFCSFVCYWWSWLLITLFRSLGLCDWFQLALQEHSDDSHVCWNPKLSRPRERGSVPVWSHEGEAPSHSDYVRVQPNPNSRYHCNSTSRYESSQRFEG